MNAQTLKVIYYDTAALMPHARNARKHTQEQVKQIAASIKQFGFNNPVLLDGAKGIIAGHGRVLAARLLDMAKVPCIDLIHLNDTEKRAYLLADNKIALNATWDADVLSEEMEALNAMQFPVEVIGFSEVELRRLADDLSEKRISALTNAGGEKKQSHDATMSKAEQDYLPFSVMLQPNQRDIVYRAIRLAKENQNMAHSHDALTFICRRYCDGN